MDEQQLRKIARQEVEAALQEQQRRAHRAHLITSLIALVAAGLTLWIVSGWLDGLAKQAVPPDSEMIEKEKPK